MLKLKCKEDKSQSIIPFSHKKIDQDLETSLLEQFTGNIHHIMDKTKMLSREASLLSREAMALDKHIHL